MPGPKPQPTALKIIRGNPGKRPLPKDEPQLPIAAAPPPPPPELAGDPVALAEWARLEPVLRGARVLTEGDRGVLIAACRAWAQYQDASAHVQADGLMIKRSKRARYGVQNPYLGIANRALAQCVRLWAELGLTPAARTRVVAAQQRQDADQLDSFLQS